MLDREFGRRFESQHEQLPLNGSSAEYRRGEIPFAFEYAFQSGTRLIAEQDEDGIGHVTFRRGNETLYDIRTVLPPGVTIVTPTYFRKFLIGGRGKSKQEDIGVGGGDSGGEYAYPWSWKAQLAAKQIEAGEFTNIRELLSLLHEGGHLADPKRFEILAEEGRGRKMLAKKLQTKPEKRRKHLAVAETRAKLERRAWASAILNLRTVGEEVGFDIREIFPTFKDLKNYVHSRLESYRQADENASQDSGSIELNRDIDFLDDLEEAYHGKGVPLRNKHDDPWN